MADGCKYDVFISYSRKDYVQDEQPYEGNVISKIMNLFDENGISYWIDEKGIHSGDEFMGEIAAAITNSTMMVFVSSFNSNQSEWTAGEISTARKKKKKIIPVLIDESDFSDKFIVALEQLDHVDYCHQPNTALSDLLRAVKDEKQQQLLSVEEKRKGEEAQKRKKQIATEGLRFLAREKVLKDIIHRVVQLHEEMGHDEKVCPVCQCSLPLDEPYCLKCGWYFHPLDQLCEGEDFLDEDAVLQYEERLALSRSLWKPKRSPASSKVVAELQQRIETLQTTIQDLTVQLEELKKKTAATKSVTSETSAKSNSKSKAKSKAKSPLTRSSAMLKLGRIINECNTSFYAVFSSDPISKIDLSKFKHRVQEEFGVAMTIEEMKKYETIAMLKGAVLDRLFLHS